MPFLYSSNGEVIWFHDVRHPLNRSRLVSHFHTPTALREMQTRDFDAEIAKLGTIPFSDHLTAAANTGASEPRSVDLSAPRRDRVLRALRLVAGFGALRRDQLEDLLLGNERLTAASRRVLAHRVIAELRERSLVEQLVVAGRAGEAVRASVLTATGQRVYAGLDPSYPRRGRPVSIVMLSHAVARALVAGGCVRATLALIKGGPSRVFSWEAE